MAARGGRGATTQLLFTPLKTALMFTFLGHPFQGQTLLGGRGLYNLCQVVAPRAHCVHIAHAEAEILTQQSLSLDWLHRKAAKPT